MTQFTAAVIGTGPEPDNQDWGNSAAMAYRHAPGYTRLDNCELIACSDIIRENAVAFAEEFDIDEDNVFTDNVEMLETVEPDILSVTTPVPTHAPIVLECLKTGIPSAIHCEKPMATTWGDARLMAQEADRRDVQLTFNHQRRMVPPWRTPKELVEAGEIGDIERVEIACGELLDNGTHFIDLANMYNGEAGIEWVIGQVDYRTEHVKYGAHNENHGFAHFKYENGVDGIVSTGYGNDLIEGTNRIIGTDGEIRVLPPWQADNPIKIKRDGQDGWEGIDPEGRDISDIQVAIEHLVECLDNGTEPELSARRVLSVTEVIFGVYESSRKRGRVEFPLRVDDNPLEAMVESGELQPESSEE